MNLKQLLFAKSLAETHSFSKAADICCVTQPTLSNAISQLEGELGGKLFIRTTRNVDTTAFGEYILPYICSILDDRDELNKAAYAYHNPKHKLLRIGLSPLVDIKFLDQVLFSYKKSHPDVSIFFKECLLDDLDERLRKSQIDFAVVPQGSQKDRNTCFFYEEPLYYLQQDINLNRQFKLNELPDIPIILTGGGCGLNNSLEDVFKKGGAVFDRYPGQALSYNVIEEWVSIGIGAGILPKAKIAPESDLACPLLLNNGKPATFSYEWMWMQDFLLREDLLELIEYLQNRLPFLVKERKKLAIV